MRICLVAVTLPLLAAAVLPCAAQAQAVRTIRVTGSGAVSDSPTQVTIRGTLSAGDESIEKSADKFTKLRDTFSKALGADKHPGLAVEFAGEKLVRGRGGAWAEAAALAVPGGFDDAAPVEVGQYSMSEEVVLRVPIASDMEREGIAKQFGKVIDAATKAGLTLGAAKNPMMAAMGMVNSPGVTQFELDEKGKRSLRAKAYTAAMSDARTRAATLAELSGGKLGKVISVEEAASPETGNDLQSMQMAMLQRMFGGAIGASDGGIDHNGLIELRQDLVVTFELVE